MSWIEIKGLKEARAKHGTDATKLVEAAAKEARAMTAEENAQFDKLTAEYDSVGKQVEFLERRSADAKAEGFGAGNRLTEDKGDGNEREREARNAYLRGRATSEQRSLLKFVDGGQHLEYRALTTAGIGQVGVKGIGPLVVTLKDYTGVLQAGATVLNTADGNPFVMPTMTDVSSVAELLGENTTAATGDPTFGNVSFDAYTYSSKQILVPNQLVQDNAFDLEGHVLEEADKRIGRLFNAHTTTGTGSSQPRGFVTAASVGKTAASTTTYTYGELVDFIHSVDPAYRNMPDFAVQANDAIIASVRKMVDTASRPIWSPQDGFNNILGVKFVTNNAMSSALTTGQKIMAAGSWSRYYVQQVQGVRILKLVERYADANQTAYVIFKRLDGDLVDTSAIKLLALA